MIETHNWVELKQYSPNKLKQLCNLCYDFEDCDKRIELKNPNIFGKDVATIQELIYRIVTEYFRIIQLRIEDEKQLKSVKDDIKGTLSMFFDDKGKIKYKELAADFRMHLEKGTIKDSMPLFIVPFKCFINSYIYDSLMESWSKSEKTWLTQFIDKSADIEPVKKYEKKEWKRLRYFVPDNLKKLCLLCDYYDKKIFKLDDRQGIESISEVIKEYFYILEKNSDVEDIWEPVKENIKKDNFTDIIYNAMLHGWELFESSWFENFIECAVKKAGILPEIQYKKKELELIKEEKAE